MMAAIKPEKITGKVMYSLKTVFPIVLATAWSLKIKKEIKLKKQEIHLMQKIQEIF